MAAMNDPYSDPYGTGDYWDAYYQNAPYGDPGAGYDNSTVIPLAPGVIDCEASVWLLAVKTLPAGRAPLDLAPVWTKV